MPSLLVALLGNGSCRYSRGPGYTVFDLPTGHTQKRATNEPDIELYYGVLSFEFADTSNHLGDAVPIRSMLKAVVARYIPANGSDPETSHYVVGRTQYVIPTKVPTMVRGRKG